MKPNPSRQSMEERERALRLAETVQVLAQPHRRGYDGDMACALGAFVRQQDCGRRCYEGGKLYKLLVAKWRRAEGIPQRERIEEEGTHGGGKLEDEVVNGWLEQIKACENAMKCSGVPGFRAANAMILDEIPPQPEQYGPVKRAITQLAICLGLFSE